MGEEIQKDNFEQADYDRFQQRLEEETEFVRSLFAKGTFDNSSRNLGYELELCLADAVGNPSRNNIEIIDATGNPLFTSELAKFNMEINGNPFPYETDVFNRVEADLKMLFQQAEDSAHKFDTQIGMFGVFPSVTPEHLNPDGYMTELHRYNQLNRQLLDMRGQAIRLHLEGDEILKVEKDDVMLEALATSLQIHLQVPFDEIVPTYHAGLWSSMLVLGATANAPLVLGKCCWQESRIGIFNRRSIHETPRKSKIISFRGFTSASAISIRCSIYSKTIFITARFYPRSWTGQSRTCTTWRYTTARSGAGFARSLRATGARSITCVSSCAWCRRVQP
ncbi:MAG: hypothetical protein OEV07_12755 [Gammaproteobacteria bacterium]|nr:hypothetical protein [Gammaproteobacteria bacterium]